MLLTLVARHEDALILAMTVQYDEDSSQKTEEYQKDAKNLVRKLMNQYNWPCQIEIKDMIYYAILEDGVVFVTLCQRNFSNNLAFSFLSDIKAEFFKLYKTRVREANRPYCFIEFADDYIEQAKTNYTDVRKRRHYSRLNEELQDVHRIMLENIEGVLQRGESLSMLDEKALKLKYNSEIYLKDAKKLSFETMLYKYGPIVFVLLLLFILIIRYKYF